MKKNRILCLSYAGVCLALALVLPFLTAQIPTVGKFLCPMHLPTFLCGMLCGGPWGAVVGAIAPFLRMAVFGAPKVEHALPMTFELAIYGLVSGLLYRRLHQKKWGVFASLLPAMILGRLAAGAVKYVMLFAGLLPKMSLAIFWTGTVAETLPGVLLQLILVPLVVLTLKRAGLVPLTGD